MRALLPIAVGFLLVPMVACKNRPKGVISDDKMVDIMVDLKLAEAYVANYPGSPTDSLGYLLSEDILSKHGVSRADFDSTVVWYGRNFDRYAALSEKIEKRLASKQKDFVGEQTAVEGIELWPYSKQIIISKLGASDGLFFSLDAPPLHPGEALMWKMRMNTPADGRLMLGVDYADGSTNYITQATRGQNQLEITLSTDTALEVKRAFGYLHTDSRFMPLLLDSVTLIHRKMSDEERMRTPNPQSYKLPGKYDAAKARAKTLQDSIKDASSSPSDSVDDKSKEAEGGDGFSNGLLRHSRNLDAAEKKGKGNRRLSPGRPGEGSTSAISESKR